MAFARFGRDSDVYVYADARGGFTCERCPRIGENYHCGTSQEMITHLIQFHRGRGDRVPEQALTSLLRNDDNA
jgi:hypothetical protein